MVEATCEESVYRGDGDTETRSVHAETRDLRCRHCGRTVDSDGAFATFDGDRATYRCPHCGWWTPAHRQRRLVGTQPRKCGQAALRSGDTPAGRRPERSNGDAGKRKRNSGSDDSVVSEQVADEMPVEHDRGDEPQRS